MFNINEFIRDNPTITIATLGLAVIGYLAFRSVQWILIKCGLVEEVDKVAIKTLNIDAPKVKADLTSKWWTSLSESVEYKEFKREWKALAQKSNRTEMANFLKQQYIASSVDKSDPYFGTVNLVPANFSFWMKGVAFLASYLSAKKNVSGIFVCHDLNAINKKIEEVHNNSADQRMAVILPIPGRSNKVIPQHKVTLLVEKKAGEITIALLDSMPDPEIGNATIDRDVILMDTPSRGLNSPETVFRQIVKTLQEGNIQAKLMFSTVVREKNSGCEIYALQDAIAFLKDPEFFNNVQISDNSTNIDENIKIDEINRLPPEYLIGTQSLSALTNYKEQGADFESTLIGREKSLQDYLNEHVVKGDHKLQNHYISKKLYSYMYLLMRALETMTEEDLNTIASRTLI